MELFILSTLGRVRAYTKMVLGLLHFVSKPPLGIPDVELFGRIRFKNFSCRYEFNFKKDSHAYLKDSRCGTLGRAFVRAFVRAFFFCSVFVWCLFGIRSGGGESVRIRPVCVLFMPLFCFGSLLCSQVD